MRATHFLRRGAPTKARQLLVSRRLSGLSVIVSYGTAEPDVTALTYWLISMT